MSHSLKHRFANSLGVTHPPSACLRTVLRRRAVTMLLARVGARPPDFADR